MSERNIIEKETQTKNERNIREKETQKKDKDRYPMKTFYNVKSVQPTFYLYLMGRIKNEIKNVWLAELNCKFRCKTKIV